MSQSKLCPHCGATYDGGQTVCYKDGAALFAVQESMDRCGQILSGKFRLDKLLGQGGFGAVYAATNMVLDRQVAVKLMKPECASDPMLVQRFFNEAKVGARLVDQHSVGTYDLFQDEDGTLLITMELLEGISLRQALTDAGPMSWNRAANIAGQVCRSLEEAHGKGVIHRDLKPANIMLVERESIPDFVKVLDFGIAKIFEGQVEPSITATGGFVGTPAYMPPEHIAGRKLDGRADIYSLGVILYEMVAGKLPFNADDTVMMLQMKLSVRPTALRENVPNMELPEGAEQLVMSMIGLQPEERPATAAMVRQRLEALSGAGETAEGGSLGMADTLDSRHFFGEPGPVDETKAQTPDRTRGYEPTLKEVLPSRGATVPEPAPMAIEPAARDTRRWAVIGGLVGVVALAVVLLIWQPWKKVLLGAAGEAPIEETAVDDQATEKAVDVEAVDVKAVEEDTAEGIGVEDKAVEETAAERIAVEKEVIEEKAVEEKAPPEIVVEEAVEEVKPVVEKVVVEEPVAEKAVEEVKPVVEKVVVEKAVVEEPVAEKAEKKTEKKKTEKKKIEKKKTKAEKVSDKPTGTGTAVKSVSTDLEDTGTELKKELEDHEKTVNETTEPKNGVEPDPASGNKGKAGMPAREQEKHHDRMGDKLDKLNF